MPEKKPETLASAYAKAFAEIDRALKSSSNPHFKSKYADITAVIDSIKPALVKHGLFFVQRPHFHEAGVSVETILKHEHSEAFMDLGCVVVPVDRNNAQGYGSALTYARRYGLVTAFGVPTEDDDGNAAAAAPPKRAALLNDNQWAEIVQLIEATNTDVQKFCNAYGIDSVKALPADAFGRAKTQLEKKLSGMAQKQMEPA